MEKSCLIDVIVPVYNTKQYLEKCVDSLLRQEFEDYRVTLADDGSTDGSGALCDDLAARFPERVRVLHLENGGPSAARNAAVQSSQAALIAFADSDDYVSERYLSALYGALTRYGADMAVSPVCREFVRPDGSARREMPPVMEAVAMSREKALEELCYEKYFSSFPVGKLLRRELALAHPFPPGRYFEDSFVLYRQMMDCETIAYVPEVSYFYLQRPGSLQRHFFEKRHQDLMDASEEIFTTLSESGMPRAVADAAAYKLCRGCYVTLFHAAADLDGAGFADVYRRVGPSLEKVYPTVIRSKRLSARERVLYYLARRHSRTFYRIVKTLSHS